MRVNLILFFIILLPLFSAAQSNVEYVEGEIFVKVKPGLVRRTIKRSPKANVAREIPRVYQSIKSQNREVASASTPFYNLKGSSLTNLYRIKLDSNNFDELLKKLKNDPQIEYAERVPRREIISTPNDSRYNEQWFLEKIKAKEAWQVNPGSVDVKVAVVDNAIDTDHVDLADNMLPGRDVADNDNDPNPPNSSFDHGTHVAGIVGAVTNNLIGIASAGNNRVKIIPVKATRNTSNNRFIDAGFEGIIWAANNGADIISLSWGGAGFSQTEQDIIDVAHGMGAIIIAAAGNENNSIDQYPASYNHVISVAALDDDDEKSSFSSYGPNVDISAPGRSILSTIPDDLFTSFNGTSMATPLVSACAGYLMSCFPTMPVDSVEIVLKTTADDIDGVNSSYISQLGAGRVNLLKAIACKNSNLIDADITAIPNNYFCIRDSVNLVIPRVGSETFEWLTDNTVIGSTQNVWVKSEGSYIVRRTLGDCILSSSPFQVVQNRNISEAPLVPNIYMPYCSDTSIVARLANDPTQFGPKTFQYTGPQVGFDGFEQSGDLPFVNVDEIGGLIDTIAVSITWQKKDGGDFQSCGIPDGGGTPFNEEVYFRLISPYGEEIDLVQTNTYRRGSSSSGSITTVFSMNGVAINSGDLPASGNFQPAESFDPLRGTIPVGKWQLFAQDNAILDPLCVTGFALTIKTIEPTSDPQITWYNSSQLISTRDTLLFSGNKLGDSTIYVQGRVEGLCPSELKPVKVNIEPIPKILAFERSQVLLTEAQATEVAQAMNYEVQVGDDHLYRVAGVNASNQPFEYLIANSAPMKTPVSLCGEKDLALFGMGCNGTITWSTGETQMGIYLEGINSNTVITATCNQAWECAPIANIPFQLTTNNQALTLQGYTEAGVLSSQYGAPISSNQLIKEAGKVTYTSPQSIEMLPGFETESAAVFKAEIGNCLEP